jgi:hypothetical protein
MKKLFILMGVFLLIYCIYYDLQTGTLPITKVVAASDDKEAQSSKQGKKKDQNYIEVKVKPGDTVLSLLEHHQKGKLPVSISKVIEDFKDLNDVVPEKIQIGKSYKIPLYK